MKHEARARNWGPGSVATIFAVASLLGTLGTGCPGTTREDCFPCANGEIVNACYQCVTPVPRGQSCDANPCAPNGQCEEGAACVGGTCRDDVIGAACNTNSDCSNIEECAQCANQQMATCHALGLEHAGCTLGAGACGGDCLPVLDCYDPVPNDNSVNAWCLNRCNGPDDCKGCEGSSCLQLGAVADGFETTGASGPGHCYNCKAVLHDVCSANAPCCQAGAECQENGAGSGECCLVSDGSVACVSTNDCCNPQTGGVSNGNVCARSGASASGTTCQACHGPNQHCDSIADCCDLEDLTLCAPSTAGGDTACSACHALNAYCRTGSDCCSGQCINNACKSGPGGPCNIHDPGNGKSDCINNLPCNCANADGNGVCDRAIPPGFSCDPLSATAQCLCDLGETGNMCASNGTTDACCAGLCGKCRNQEDCCTLTGNGVTVLCQPIDLSNPQGPRQCCKGENSPCLTDADCCDLHGCENGVCKSDSTKRGPMKCPHTCSGIGLQCTMNSDCCNFTTLQETCAASICNDNQ